MESDKENVAMSGVRAPQTAASKNPAFLGVID